MNTCLPIKPLRSFLAVWLLLVLAGPARAQFENAPWKPLGPTGGKILSLFTSGPYVYAGGRGVVFRSENKGAQWLSISDSLPQRSEVNDIKEIGTDLFIGTSNGVFKRPGGATHWESVNNWPASALSNARNLGPDVRAISVVGEALYAGTKGKGLYVLSQQDGKWKGVKAVDTTATVWDIVSNDQVGLVSTSKGTFRWDGTAWAVTTALPPNIRCFARKDANLYAGGQGGVYDLGDAATGWTQLNQNLALAAGDTVYSLSANGRRLLAGTLRGRVYRATNLTDWAEAVNGLTIAGRVDDVLEITDQSLAGNYLLAVNSLGVNTTRAGAINWKLSNENLINTDINEVSVIDGNVYVAAAGAVYRWKGGGMDWQEIKGNFPDNTVVYSILKHQGLIYCATSKGVYFLPDAAGTAWQEFTGGFAPGDKTSPSFRLASMGPHLLVQARSGIYRSTNRENWQPAGNGIEVKNNFAWFERLAVAGNRVFIFINSTQPRRIYYSDNFGDNWQDAKAPNAFFTGLTGHNGEVLSSLSRSGGTGVYQLDKNAQTWNKISNFGCYEITSNGQRALFSASTIQFRGDPKRTYEIINFSRDGGKEWFKISNASLPQNIRVKAIAATDTHVYIATWENGVWVLPLPELYGPAVTTGAATGVTATTATLTGTAGSELFESNFAFEYSQGRDSLLGNRGNTITLPGVPKMGQPLAVTQPLAGLQPSTTYYYRLVGSNSGQVSRQGIMDSFRTDALTRIVSHQEPDKSAIEGTASAAGYPRVSLTLNAGFPAQTGVNLRVKGARQSGFATIPVPFGNNAFEVQLPAEHLDDLGLQYYFEVLPAPGYGAPSATPTVTLAVGHAAGKTIDKLNFANRQYQLLAFPLVLENRELAAVLGDELPRVQEEPDPTRWRVVRYNKQSDPFPNLSASSPLEPGNGYFLATTESIKLPLNTGSGITVARHERMGKDYFEIDLQPNDWTLIGNPFAWDVAWEYVANFNGNPGWLQFWSFDNATGQLRKPSESTTLFAYGGGYVKNNDNQVKKLRIPVGIPPGRVGAAPKAEAQMLLSAEFTLRTGNTSAQFAGLGLHPLAQAGLDAYDLELPPALGGTPSLRFAAPGAAPLTRSVLPPTGEGQTWEFTVTGTDQPVTLSWTVKAEPGKQLWLHDLATERKTDMLAATSHAFQGPGRFRVYYGPAGYVNEHLRPERNLVQAYPNPFARNTTLRFTLPPGNDGCRVRLTLLDAQGRRLGTVAEGTFGSGFHQVEVPPGRLPAGVYTVEATFDGPALRTVQHLKLVRQ